MGTLIDARGLSCPQPVILTISKMKELGTGEFSVLVDTDASRENVSRAAISNGWKVRDIVAEGQGYRLMLMKG